MVDAEAGFSERGVEFGRGHLWLVEGHGAIRATGKWRRVGVRLARRFWRSLALGPFLSSPGVAMEIEYLTLLPGEELTVWDTWPN
jgi:hypothetical protein